MSRHDAALPVRVQLCGPLTLTVGTRRADKDLPGRQGRLLLAFLTLRRGRLAPRDSVVDALWSDRPPRAADNALAALLSKLRTAIRPLEIVGRSELRLVLPTDAWVDVEAAENALCGAQSAVAQGRWAAAWTSALTARCIAERPFLVGHDAAWVDEQRRAMEDVHLLAVEAYGTACLGLGGTELPGAARAGRELVTLAPLRESGYRLLMRAKAASGNSAEGLRIYENLCRLLADELGVPPSPATQRVYEELLGLTSLGVRP